MNLTPVNTASDLIRKSLETQCSLLMSASGTLMNVSLRLSELNRQANRRLLEEAAADMQKAMRIHSIPEAQAFLAEQSLNSLEKFRGYVQNLQAITARTWPPTLEHSTDTPAVDAAPTPAAEEAHKHAAVEHKQEHEAGVPPSALVETLIASAVADKPAIRS